MTHLGGERGRSPAVNICCPVGPLPWREAARAAGWEREELSVRLARFVLCLFVLEEGYERLPRCLALWGGGGQREKRCSNKVSDNFNYLRMLLHCYVFVGVSGFLLPSVTFNDLR